MFFVRRLLPRTSSLCWPPASAVIDPHVCRPLGQARSGEPPGWRPSFFVDPRSTLQQLGFGQRPVDGDPLGIAEESGTPSGTQRFSRRAMANPYNVNIDETIVPIYPGTENALNRKQGSVKKEVFAREMLERSGLTDLIPYNEDTQEQVARKMATEALMALEFDNNAIGWYDEKLRQAKNILNLVEPSIFENETNETTFDYALAVTSNGTAVIDNFPYALQAYRFYQENGRLPVAEWKQGGKRNKQMKRAFKFFNDYQTLYNEGQIDLPLSSFLDSQYQVRDLKKVIRDSSCILIIRQMYKKYFHRPIDFS